MLFDAGSESAVRAMWGSLEARGLRSPANTRTRNRPHVTLTVTDGMHRAHAEAAAEPLLSANDLSLRLGSISVFPGRAGVVYLAVVPTLRLLRLHHAVHARLANAGVESWRHYLPDTWVPHCTLAEGLSQEQVATAVQVVRRVRPITADVIGVGLIDTDTGAVTMVADVPHSASTEPQRDQAPRTPQTAPQPNQSPRRPDTAPG